jgi:acetoacetyl-CoA synthetase
VCVGRKKECGDEDVVLFVVLHPTWAGNWQDLELRIRKSIAAGLSLRHVPKWIVRCPEVPVTGNGKKVEVVVKGIVCGRERVGAAVSNVGCLEFFRSWTRENQVGEWLRN